MATPKAESQDSLRLLYTDTKLGMILSTSKILQDKSRAIIQLANSIQTPHILNTLPQHIRYRQSAGIRAL
jgi:hypothetical protein